MIFTAMLGAGSPPSKKAVRDAIARFEERGESNHSARGVLLAPILTHRLNKHISFTLTYYGVGGYRLKKGES